VRRYASAVYSVVMCLSVRPSHASIVPKTAKSKIHPKGHENKAVR